MIDLVILREEILPRITFLPGVEFDAEQDPHEGLLLFIAYTMPNAVHPDEAIDLRIKTFVPPCKTVAAFLDWLTWRLERIASHEVREWLRFGDIQVNDPHRIER